MVKLGLAEAIVDVVETGDTLRENNLEVYSEIGKYQTSLFANRSFTGNSEVGMIVRRLEGIIIAGRYSMLEYNIPKTSLQKAEVITPGFESPTIAELEDKSWLAVKVMVEAKKIPAIMDDLEAIGATAIFETEIRNCRIGTR
jgi:ATP phosphoribosyltransferase